MAATIRLSQQHSCSLNHLISEQLHRVWHREAQGFRSLEIDYEFELGRPLHREVSGLLSPQNSTGVDAALAIRIRKVGSVAHKPARDSKVTQRIHCGNRMARRERDDLIALCRQERVNAYKERVNALLRYSREGCFYLSFGTSSQDNELKPKYTCSGLHIPQLFLSARKIWIHECRDGGSTGNEFAQQSELL